ncbi:MAG TPA: IclR family transcriptional regulator [Dehalococcoidia bacterium]|nr:IclR family transcriptional regulator [Dehalococcoidia bacterium]
MDPTGRAGATAREADSPRRFKPIQAVVRASSVLKAFGDAKRELGIGELAERVQLSPSTVYRLVATLCASGLLERNQATGKYYPGLNLFILAQTAIPQQIVARESGPALESLAQAVGEAASLGCLQGDRVVLLRLVDVAKVLRVDLQPGDTLPAATSALGRVLLAGSPASGPAARPDLAAVGLAGYAVDRDGAIPGVASLAAPVRDFHGDVVAAVGVSAPVTRLSEDRVDDIRPLVITAAEAVSRRLGWTPHTQREGPA